MPSFHYKVKVHSSKSQAYETLKDIESFSNFMNSVKKIDILKKQGNVLKTEWIVDFDGVPIQWTEELIYNDEKFIIKFESLTGDYIRRGQWFVYQDSDNKTWVSLEMTYDWNAPNFEYFFGDIYNKKAEKATKGMLYALKKRISK
ncbi:MAG: SRPBCC family protein [Endomicrobiaceae bacterium]